jgi:type II secretory pathway pseudopilin PulG
MRRISGFTLIEICLAIAIGLLIVTMTVPSVTGLFAEQKLKRSFDEFDTFVRTAQLKSVTERRDYVMLFEEGGVSLEPADPTEEDAAADPERFALPEGADITLDRPVALEKNPPMEWPFWKSGTCEPVVVSYRGEAGIWVAKYDPLTVRGALLEQHVK